MGDCEQILIVEDAPTQRALLRFQLQSHGYGVVEAKCGEEARKLIETERIDAVLLDWELPDVEGITLLEEWTKDPELRWIPVLMVTAHGDANKLIRALDLGAVDFVHKPTEELELVARLRSVSRMRKLQEELRRFASVDPLTGLLNRRILFEKLEEELVRQQRSNKSLCVAILDIDHFKSVNDTHGHDVGDIILKQFAELLGGQVRSIDRVARFGGEEFVIVFPETDLEQAMIPLQRMRAVAQSTSWGLHPQTPLKISFSGGLSSSMLQENQNSKILLKKADLALYRAKNNGRDRIETEVAEGNSRDCKIESAA